MIYGLCVLCFGVAAMGFSLALMVALNAGAKSYQNTYERELTQTLESMFLFIPAARLVMLGWTLAATMFCLTYIPFCQPLKPLLMVLGLPIAGLFALGAFQLPKLLVRYLTRRRREKLTLQLLEALPMMSNALRAGFSIQQAFGSVADNMPSPMSQEISLFLQQMRVGMSFDDALHALDERVQVEEMTLVCTAVDIARRTGGNLTEIFDTITQTVNGRITLHQHVKTLTAQGRLQGLIIGAMPFLLGIGLAIFKPALMIPFVMSLMGAITLAVVVTLVALGAWIIKRIITIDI